MEEADYEEGGRNGLRGLAAVTYVDDVGRPGLWNAVRAAPLFQQSGSHGGAPTAAAMGKRIAVSAAAAAAGRPPLQRPASAGVTHRAAELAPGGVRVRRTGSAARRAPAQ